MPTFFRWFRHYVFTKNVKLSIRIHVFCKIAACPDHRKGPLPGQKPGHIIIIYPAFTGFPVAGACFFHLSGHVFIPRKQALCPPDRFLACGLLYYSCLPPFCPASIRPHRTFSRFRDAAFFPRRGIMRTEGRMPQIVSSPTSAGLTVPLFSVFLGGTVFLTPFLTLQRRIILEYDGFLRITV